MKTLFTTWVSSLKGTLGISVLENEEGERSIRACPIEGKIFDYDNEMIRDWGGKVSVNDLQRMINLVKQSELESFVNDLDKVKGE